MSDKTFVDTNILIYAHDADAKSKHGVAKSILAELWSQRTGVLSMQVLQEFYVNVTRKIAVPLPKDVARMVVISYAIWCVETTPAENSSAFLRTPPSPPENSDRDNRLPDRLRSLQPIHIKRKKRF